MTTDELRAALWMLDFNVNEYLTKRFDRERWDIGLPQRAIYVELLKNGRSSVWTSSPPPERKGLCYRIFDDPFGTYIDMMELLTGRSAEALPISGADASCNDFHEDDNGVGTQELYDAMGGDGEDMYLGDGIWITSGGSSWC